MNLPRLPRVITLAAMLSLAWAGVSAAAPGSGTAIISPTTIAAGSSGTWTITYTATEPFKDGTVRLTIPAGWTAPQNGSPVSPGYVSVSTNEPTGNPSLAIGGSLITVTVDTLTAANTITITYGVGPTGLAQAATNDSTYTFEIASDPAGTATALIATSPTVQVNPAAPAYLTVAPDDTTVTAGDFAHYRLFVFDTFGNRSPLPSSRTVNFFPTHGQFYLTDDATPIGSVAIPAAQSSVEVHYRATLATTGTPHQLGALTLTGSPQLGGSADVSVVAGPLSTGSSLISATTPVVADGISQSSVEVTSRDAFGNPRQGDTVTLGVDGNADPTDPGPTTDGNGRTSGVVTDETAETVTVSAFINAQLIAATAPIDFVAGGVSGVTSTVDATTPVIANGVATSTITVTARDAQGNPVSGQNVTLALLPTANAVLTQPGGVTNGLGQVTGTLTSTVPGPRTITAVIGVTPLIDNAVVNFTSGPLASFQWTEVDGNAVAGVAETVRLTAKDALGNTVAGYAGTVTLTASSGGSGTVTWTALGTGTLTPTGSNTATYTFAAGDNGTVQLTMRDTRAETITLSASAGAPAGSSGSIVVAPAAPDKVFYDTGDSQSATVNTAVGTPPRVRVTDVYNNPVGGATVTFRVITTVTGVGTVDVAAGGPVDSTGTTNTSGFIACDVWRLGTAAGANRLRALITSGTVPSVTFNATGTAGNEASLVLAPGSKNVTANQTEDVTATLRDGFSNLKPNTRVDISITSVNGGVLEAYPGYATTQLSPTARWGTTDAAGEIRVRFRAPATAGLANTVDASTSVIGQGSVTDVVYTSSASGATNLRITFVGSSTAAAGTTLQFDVEAVDGTGNRDATNTSPVNLIPEAGSTLLFSLSDFGATITSFNLVAGVRRIYAQATKAGDWDITVDGSGLGPDTKQASITDTGAIDHYVVTTVPSVVAGVTFNVSVQAQDVHDNLVVGANNTVTLEAIDDVTTSPALSTLLVNQTTLSGGLATQAETYTKAEPIRVRASAAGKQGISGVVNVSAATAYRIAKVSGDAAGIAVGGEQILVAQVLDAFDNLVQSETVTFAVQSGGGSVNPVTASTNAAGNAQATLTTGTTPGNNAVKATILDENPGSLERVDYLVETVPGGIAYFTVVPAKFNPIAGEAVNLTVTAFDAEDNVVSDDNTTQIQLSSGSGTVQFGAATGTLTAGVFSTTVTDNVAEQYTVTAELLGGGPPGNTSAVVTVGHAPAFDVVYVSGNASGVTAGSQQVLQVRVRDAYTNPVLGQPVTFAVASSPGGATITDAVGDPNDGITTTNAAGLAQATLNTSAVSGTNQVNARILDGLPPDHLVPFTVDTSPNSATTLRITFLGPTTVAAGQTSSFKVEALDAGQNLDTSNTSLITLTPQAGSNLDFSLSDFVGGLTQFNLVGGTRTIFVQGTKTGSWNITVDDGPSGLASDTKGITVNDAGVVDHYVVTAPSNAVAGATWNVSVEARDQYGNKVIGASNLVNLVAVLASDSTSLAGSSLSVGQATLTGGSVVVNESYTRAQGIRVRARDAGSKEGFSAAVQIGAAIAYQVVNVSGDGIDIVAGTTRTLTGRVVDSYNNPVQNQTVSFTAVSGGGNFAGGATAQSDINGTVVKGFNTGNVVGINVARASILDGNPIGVETTDFTVSTKAGALDNYEVVPVDPLKINLVANETTSVIARARDQYNNYRIQDNATVVSLSATGSAVLGSAGGTLVNGAFTTTVRDDVAENFTVTAETGLDSGTSNPFTVSPGPPYRIVKVTADPVNDFPLGNQQPLVSEVRDQWDNAVGAGVSVTHLIVQAPDPSAYLRDAVGDTTDGITTTAANGQATARLGPANTAGLNRVSATILDGSPSGLERVTYDVNTVAGGIAKYQVTMGATSAVAGTPVSVSVQALDANDNPVDDDVTQVDLAGNPGTGLVFAENPLTLSGGTASTTVTASLVQTYAIKASSVLQPAVSGQGASVVVSPAAPAGVITATATADVITANGSSVTTLTSSVIRDAFGNQVPAGGGVTVTTSGGVILGTQPKIIGANGRVSFDLRSSTTPGPVTVSMTSVAGTAFGQKIIQFAQPVAFNTSQSPVPSIVKPGDNPRFRVVVANTSSTAANLTTATRFAFADGVHTFNAFLAAPRTVAAADTATLVFNNTILDAAFVSGAYTPVVTLIGNDQYGSAFNVSSALPLNAVQVTSIEITLISAPSPVSRGQTRNVSVSVRNNGATAASLDNLTLSFSPGVGLYTPGTPAPALPVQIAAGNTATVVIPVTIETASGLGTDQIDAFAEATVSGQPVTDDSVDPHPLGSWQIVAQANLAYVPGSLTPPVASRGKSYAFQMTIQNTGSGVVSLSPALTRLTFTDGSLNFSAAPVQAYAIPGGATQVLTFVDTAIPGGFATGPRDVVLNAQGTDNGAPFTQLVSTVGSGDQLNIVTPAVLTAVAGTLSPVLTTQGATATFQVAVNNTGGATVDLIPPTTTLSFTGFNASLDPTGPTSIGPLGNTTLRFIGTPVSAGSTPPGNYFPQIDVDGTENGLDYSASFASPSSVNVQAAPDILIAAILPSQGTITTDQARRIQVRMVVQNNGGATVSLTSASIRMFSGAVERTAQFGIASPTAFQGGGDLAPASVDTLLFQVSDAAGPMSAGPLTIEGLLNVEDTATSQPITANTGNGGKGALSVQTPATINILAVTPSLPTVTAGMDRDFTIRALIRNGGQSDVNVNAAAATLQFTPPGGWVRAPRATLGSGSNLLQGGEVDTLIFDVTTSGSVTGTVGIDATVGGTESNSGRTFGNASSGAGSIVVQTAGNIVASVASSRATITSGANVPWTLTVTVQNTGGADVDLDLGAAVLVSFGGATTPPVPSVPPVLAGGGTLLSGGETDQFVISVPTAGVYGALGPQNMQVLVTGTELNSTVDRFGNGAASVIVQAAPDVAYISLTPSPVARGVSVPFAVTVRNPVANGATLTLDPVTTRLQFASGSFDAGLAGGPVTLAALEQKTLLFNSTVIPGGTPTGSQDDAELILNWTENGRSGGATVQVTDGDIVVEEAPELGIVSLIASRATVTAGQTSPTWTVDMVVRNLGGLPVDIDVAADSTYLVMNLLQGGLDVSDEYTIAQPTKLESAGGTLLGPSLTDTLRFTIQEAGLTPGTVIISGLVTGHENSTVVMGNTDAGGTGSFELQAPGELAIRSITPARTTATVGQTSTYRIRMAVENTGGAAIDLDLTKPNTDLGFSNSGWFTTLDGSLAGGGVTLSGGEVDTVTFTVDTTGGPADVVTITGVVAGEEINTATSKFDDTVSGGTGSITLQDAAALSIINVARSRASITESTGVPWTIDVDVQNTGGAPAQLDLPGGVSASVQDGAVSFAPVVTLQGGGSSLAPGQTGRLVFQATANGAFSSYGAKIITIDVNGSDINSGDPLNATSNAASILVQKAPVLQLVRFDPFTVTSGANARFNVRVSNPDADAATVTFDRGNTRVHFAAGVYSAFLDLNSPVAIAGGEDTTLVFDDKTVVSSIPLGKYDFNANLAYSANGVPVTFAPVLLDTLSVQAAPTLSIDVITASQSTVTAGQQADWTVTMTLRNSGTQPITLDLTPAATYLTFVAPGAQVDGDYQVIPPTGLQNAGDGVLGAGLTDFLQFTIDQTGSLTGPVTINGRVRGLVGGVTEVLDDTFDGGRGNVNVQSAAAVAITAIRATQPRATAGQSAAWGIRVILANTGSSDVDLNFPGPVITFDGADPVTAGWNVTPPTALLSGGGARLAGGSVDSLVFTVNVTGPAGTPVVAAEIPYIEVNTQQADTLLSGGLQPVVVEEPPSLHILTTNLLAPNAPNVNTGQGYSVAVNVENSGGAAARDVQLEVESSNGWSTITPVPAIPLVGGAGQTVLVPVPATADTPGLDFLTARIVSALDDNSGEAAPVVMDGDTTEAVNVQTPAQLTVVLVSTSQASVTQGQSNPWNVIVTVENGGGADLDLTAPTNNDLVFRRGAAIQNDYSVVPPTAFASGNPAWRLAGGAVDSLVYEVVSTGAQVGLVDITAPVAGTDRNQPANKPGASGGAQVTVQPAAGLSILSTVTVGTVNHATANRDTVNTNFAYEIHVTVQNLGEAVDSVLVDLVTDDGSVITPQFADRQSIDADAQHTFVFGVTAPPVATPLETFTATIAPGVVSRNSGQPVTPQPPIDATQVVVAQRPANLVTTLAITSPPTAVGGTVSPGQQFQVTARVNNTGQALVGGAAEVELTLPAGFTTSDDTLRAFVANQPVVWSITAPGAEQAADTFVCAITTRPLDVNTGQLAFASVPSAVLLVTVGSGGGMTSPTVSIIGPTGAIDGTVSAGQPFTVDASVVATLDTENIVATIAYPPGFSVSGSPDRAMGNGTGAAVSINPKYTVTAPSTAGVADIHVTFSGTDANSGDPVSAVDTLRVTVVPGASLSVSASITGPPEATDGSVGVSTPFVVEATVDSLAGTAGISGLATISITPPAGYTLDAGSAIENFTVGVPVQWTLRSPAIPTPTPGQIQFRIEAIPVDENSGQTAQVTTRTASIAILTEGATVAVTEVSSGLGLNDGPVPGGTAGINLLGLRIAYNASDANAPDAAIDNIAITVVDKNGQPLGNSTLAQTLKRLTVDLGAQTYEVVDPSANPVMVDLTGGGIDRIILPDSFVTAVVGVDLDASPKVTEFSVGIRTGGVTVRDTGSGQNLSITDGNGNALDGQITSDPLIVLSSSFEEYVHNYPNPFRAGTQSTRITYLLDQPSDVTIKVYSMTGELVWEESISRSDPGGQAGAQEAEWDGRNGNGEVVRNGVYVCVLNAGSKSAKFRIAVAK